MDDELPTLPAGDISLATDGTLTVGGVVPAPGRYRYGDTDMVLEVAEPVDDGLVDDEDPIEY